MWTAGVSEIGWLYTGGLLIYWGGRIVDGGPSENTCLVLTRALVLLLGAAAASAQSPPTLGLPPDLAAFVEGGNLPQVQAEAVENKLKGSPEDLVSHCKLIPYYFFHEDSPINWQRHLFWLIDHHPESGVFDTAIPTTYMVVSRWKQLSPEVLIEFRRHWEQAVAANPKNAAVLLHAATAISGSVLNNTTHVSEQDHNLGFAYARKAVEADPKCTLCRKMVGFFNGSAILRLPDYKVDDSTCLPGTPEVVKMVFELRKEIESSTDPEIIVDAGMTIMERLALTLH
jgi:hypothetical protein